ncbi:MAG: ATP phosphoribosyltransferase [Verrucomicrobiota bacterium]|nr:ATP phosphoribosyltransferase [Verrucomicrobiota bacterium]
MLKIAIPNKGSLSKDAVELLLAAGYKCKRYGRELALYDNENDIEFIFLRPRDIAVYVGNGTLDLGITGHDLLVDSEMEVVELMKLNFGKSKFHYAVPNESSLLPANFSGQKIATSYPNVVKKDLAKRGINAKIIRLDGAVEISIRLGVADVIADVVESGRTLKEAGLKIVGDTVLFSEAVLIARDKEITQKNEIEILTERLRGILVARTHAMIEYDIPENCLKAACNLTPGIESPTVSKLAKKDWLAVKSMVESNSANKIMDQLKKLGAKGIFISEIKSCRM